MNGKITLYKYWGMGTLTVTSSMREKSINELRMSNAISKGQIFFNSSSCNPFGIKPTRHNS